MAMAKRAALLDFNQYVVKKIHHHTGDYRNRKTSELYIEYADGDMRWQTWSLDLFSCQVYADFCKQRPELWSMFMTVIEATRVKNKINKDPIEDDIPDDTLYVNLRVFGGHRYNGNEDLQANSCFPTLPKIDYSIYMVPFYFLDWGNAQHTTMRLYSKVLDRDFKWNHDSYLCWGQYYKLYRRHKLVDEAFIEKFQQVKASSYTPKPTRQKRNAPRKGGEKVVEEHALLVPIFTPVSIILF